MKAIHKTILLAVAAPNLEASLHNLHELHAEVENELRKQFAEWEQKLNAEHVVERRTLRGWTYLLQLVNCGKEKCNVCRGRSYSHGPYWYGYRRCNGRMISHYIGKKMTPIDSRDGYHDDGESLDDPDQPSIT